MCIPLVKEIPQTHRLISILSLERYMTWTYTYTQDRQTRSDIWNDEY